MFANNMRVIYYTDSDNNLFQITETPGLVKVTLITEDMLNLLDCPQMLQISDEPFDLDAEILTLPEWKPDAPLSSFS